MVWMMIKALATFTILMMVIVAAVWHYCRRN
jgi:hypothetical protein